MSIVKYKMAAIVKLKNFVEQSEDDFTFGDVIYSMLRQVNHPDKQKTEWLRHITDEEFYTAVEKAHKEDTYEQSEDNKWQQ